MTEIRPIHEHEGPSFLKLLCQIFELDYDRASGIFFNEPMFDLRRKWGMVIDGELVSILTTVPLEFGWGRSIGIAGVATRADRQREGLATVLLNHVLKESERLGESAAWLFAREKGLYSRCGFEVVDEVIRAPFVGEPDDRLTDMLSFDDIRGIYDHWALQNPARLRRDDRRWKYWKWNLRVCTPFEGGYLCHEGKLVRECVVQDRKLAWRTLPESEWAGLKSLAAKLDLPLGQAESELYLMGRNPPGIPEMFMTDQF